MESYKGKRNEKLLQYENVSIWNLPKKVVQIVLKHNVYKFNDYMYVTSL